MQFQLYVRILSWVDGDTCRGVLDLSCHTYLGSDASPVRFRMSHINAPEIATATGPAARDYATQLAPPGRYQCISTGLDKYGRPLLDLPLKAGLFSQLMLAAGHAVPLD